MSDAFTIMKPTFTAHPGGEFLGHWWEYDLYLTGSFSDMGEPAIVCRYGDGPQEFGACSLAGIIDKTLDPTDMTLVVEGSYYRKAMVVGAVAVLRRYVMAAAAATRP